MGMRISAENKIQEATLVESACVDGEKVSYEFLVKWAGKSQIHNSWISESELKVLAKRKLDNYVSQASNVPRQFQLLKTFSIDH